MLQRNEKINALKSVLAGRSTVDDLVEPKDYIWNKPTYENHYVLWTPDEGETKTSFTRSEFAAYKAIKHSKHRHVLFQLQDGYGSLENDGQSTA